MTRVLPGVRRYATALTALLYAAAASAYHAPLFAGATRSAVPGHQNGQYPWRAFRTGVLRGAAQTDQATLYYPWLVLLDRTQRADVFPFWNPASFGGQPLYSNGQIGMLYPPRVLLTGLMSPAAVHDTLLVLHVALAGLCAYLLLRDLGLGWTSAVFGGTAWMFASFCTAWVHMQVCAPVVYVIPLTLLVVRRVVLRPSVPRVLAGAAVVALACVAGSLAFLGMALIAAALYGLCLAVRQGRWAVAHLAATFTIGFGLAAVLLLPSFLTAATTPRDAFGAVELDPAYLAPPRTLLYVFRPPPVVSDRVALDELAFVGTVTVALAFVGLFRRVPGAWLGRVLVTLSALVAIGGPVTSAVLYAVPGLREFRPLGRLFMFFDLGVVLLAALGMDLLLRRARHLPRATVPALAVTVLTAVELAGHGLRFGPPYNPRRDLFPETPLVTALRTDRPEGGRTPRLAPLHPPAGDGRSRPPVMTAAIPLALGLSSGSGEDSIVPGRTQALWKYAGGLSYEEATAASRSGYVARFPVDLMRLHVLERLGVTSVVTPPNLDRLWRADPRRLRRYYSGPDGVAYRVLSRAAEARLVYATDVVDTADAALRTVTSETYDATNRLLLERTQLARVDGVVPSPGGRGRVHAVTEGHNTMEVRAASDRPGWLVVPSMWDAGWSATVNGRRVPLLRGHYNLRVVPVPAGKSHVVMRYRPAGLEPGLAVTGGTAGGIVTWWLHDRRRRRAAAAQWRMGA